MKKGSLLKEFNTKDRYGNVRISVFNNFIEAVQDERFTLKRTFEDILYKHPFCLCAVPETEYEITQLVIKNFKKEKLCRKEKLCLEFYKYYDHLKIEAFEYNHNFENKYHTVKELLKFGPYGLEIMAYNRLKYLVKPDRILFAGPYSESLPVDIRRKIRDSVFNALGEQKEIETGDCFPIIDYDSLENENARFEYGNDTAGSVLTIEKGYLYYSGWSSPKDGGSQSFPLERFLYFDESFYNLLTNHEHKGTFEFVKKLILKHSIS